MAKRKKKPITLAAVRIDGSKRINLAEIRKRRAAAQEKIKPPVEDNRVSKVWDRQSRRDIAMSKLIREGKAMQVEKGRPRKTPVKQRVRNPYFQPEHPITLDNPMEIEADINIKESAVETLYARGGLNKAQKQGADRFRMFFEAMGGAGAAAMDYSRVTVDGGPSAEPLPERKANAGKELNNCRTLLGARIYDLVCKVCGEGKSLQEVYAGKRERLTAADNLRHALDDLCEMWGIGTKGKGKGDVRGWRQEKWRPEPA